MKANSILHHIKQAFGSGNRVVIECLKGLLILSLSITPVSSSPTGPSNNKVSTNKSIKNISVPIFSLQTSKNFEDIIEDLLIVIAENNFRLNQHARIGRAIAERNNSPFPQATVLHFCNLEYAQQLLEMAPDYLLRMPCRISIWPKKDKSTIIDVWLLPENDKRTETFAKKINAILINIVNYGAR